MTAQRQPRSSDVDRRLRRGTPAIAKIVSIAGDPGLVWRGPEYPVLPCGRYTVRGVGIQGPQWLPNFRRWSLRVEFTLIDDPVLVSAFFNFGADPTAKKIGRQSRYYKAWVIANGGHPSKGQHMSPNIFLEGQFFEVEIETSNLDSQNQPKADAELYSRVTKILSAKSP